MEAPYIIVRQNDDPGRAHTREDGNQSSDRQAFSQTIGTLTEEESSPVVAAISPLDQISREELPRVSSGVAGAPGTEYFLG